MSFSPGTALGAYEILSTLGIGGMGEVYRARDPRLGREVAVKVLPKSMAADPDRLERFEREARAVASLSHPNIVTIHSVEEADGLRFITMELIVGDTLDRLIPPGGLPLSRFFAVAQPIVSALAAAHKGGITHRDLKPENIMVDTNGHVRVLDFGLAKAEVSLAPGDNEATQALTQAGLLLGTVPYMSPEQIKGQNSDHRSDVFSLGTLLYEMATGERPFRGETSADVMSSILRDQPPSITELKADLPRDLADILKRCLQKTPESRYPSALELTRELIALQQTVDSGTAQTKRASIAVLPFINMSADPEQEYFCDGMAEDVIDALTRVDGIHVVARTSSFRFRGRGLDLREIGEKLGVTTVLEGSVRKSGNRVRISARLVNISNGYDLWSERFDRELDDIFALQDEISGAIVGTLKTKLVTSEAPASTPALKRAKFRPSPEAYDLLLKARFFRNSEENTGITSAMRCLREALELDPNFPQAHAMLASCYIGLFAYGFSSAEQAGPEAQRHALRGLELDDSLPDVLSVFASYNAYFLWDWKTAETSQRRALAMDPGRSDSHRNLAMTVLAPTGRLEESVEAITTAYRLDPLQSVASRNLAENLYWSGRLHDAQRQFLHTLEMGYSTLVRGQMAAIYSAQGEPEKALEVRQEELREAGKHDAANDLGKAYERAGEEGVYRWYLAGLEKRAETKPVSPYSRALLHGVLGEADKSFLYLNEAVDQHLGLLMWLKVNPWLHSLHDDPRWPKLLGRMGLS